MAKHYELVEHQLGVGQTVYGVLKYYNDHNMTAEELELARIYYLIENREDVRVAGEIVQIPVLPKYQKDKSA